jgi:hypothetical protein
MNYSAIVGVFLLLFSFVSPITTYSQTDTKTNSGIVYDTTYLGYTEEGSWNTSLLVGFNGNLVRSSDETKSSATWQISIPGGIYRLFYWNCLSDKGASDSQITIACTTATQTKPMNFQRGMTGWLEMGTYNISDGAMSVALKGGNGTILTSALKLVKADTASLQLDLLFEKAKGGIMLKIGNQKAYVNGNTTEVPDVAPTIQGDRTLVPIRFISEELGAEVNWNNDTQTAAISIGNTKVDFILNSDKYLVNGEERTLDQPAIVLSDRMMIPLRAFSDSIGKQLFWDDRGLIIIADRININANYDKDLIQTGIDAFN